MDQGLTVRTRASQAGFTLIEMMIVVAVIAALAVLVVPSWFRESRKSKMRTEVHAMFTEISIKEEQYKIENHVYLGTGVNACPASPGAPDTDFAGACLTGGTPWDNLRINPPEKTVDCSYQVTTGAANA